MKAFVIAMLAAGTVMLLAALFWPDHPQPTSQRQQHFAPIADTIGATEVELAPSHRGRPITPPRTASSVKPSAATSSNKPALETTSSKPIDQQLTSDEQDTFKQTGTDNTSLRNSDFPRTYISKVHVDLTSPNHWVTLTWSGPNARLQPTTKYHSSPGRGLGTNNCDDVDESHRTDSNCTPKGTMHIQAFSNSMVTSPSCRYVTWFDTKRGIALHYYPDVPNYPASHGCVRLNEYPAQLIHNNSKIGETEVTVEGKWGAAR